MYPASVTLFWRNKTQDVEVEGKVVTEPYPPVTQDVQGFFVEGNALILVQDKQSSYLIPLDILDAVSIFAKEAKDESTDEASAPEGAEPEGKLIVPNFGGGSEDS